MVVQPARKRQTIFVGSKIRQLRKDHNLTQAVLAKRIGVQQSDLCRMENGEYKVSLDTLFKVLGIFGMDIGDFFRDTGRPQTSEEEDRDILALFHKLDDEARNEVIEFIRYKLQRNKENSW